MNKNMKEKITNIFFEKEEEVNKEVIHDPKRESIYWATTGVVLSVLPSMGMMTPIKNTAAVISFTLLSVELYNLLKQNKKLALVKELHVTKSKTR